ncbi:MAG: DUF4252 domain-containing protein [Bacteroidales bacterium]|jgi:hypothetical protein|nr:DUF4252 domain-containing protein [Bacteroidales bacterium]
MKTKCIFISLCLFFASAGFAQNRPFQKFAEMDGVTSVSISKAMLGLIGNMSNVTGIDKAGVNISKMINRIESLQILTSETPARAAQMKRDFSQFASTHYQELMRVADGTSRVNFYSNMQGNRIKELIMLVEDEGEFTAILLVGDFSLQDIQQITNQN